MTKPGVPPAAGTGPEAVPTEAATYHAIALENERRDQAERGLGRWAGEARPALGPGEIPRLPDSSPWSQPDLLGVEPPLGEDINGSDPSGSERHKGIA